MQSRQLARRVRDLSKEVKFAGRDHGQGSVQWKHAHDALCSLATDVVRSKGSVAQMEEDLVQVLRGFVGGRVRDEELYSQLERRLHKFLPLLSPGQCTRVLLNFAVVRHPVSSSFQKETHFVLFGEDDIPASAPSVRTPAHPFPEKCTHSVPAASFPAQALFQEDGSPSDTSGIQDTAQSAPAFFGTPTHPFHEAGTRGVPEASFPSRALSGDDIPDTSKSLAASQSASASPDTPTHPGAHEVPDASVARRALFPAVDDDGFAGASELEEAAVPGQVHSGLTGAGPRVLQEAGSPVLRQVDSLREASCPASLPVSAGSSDSGPQYPVDNLHESSGPASLPNSAGSSDPGPQPFSPVLQLTVEEAAQLSWAFSRLAFSPAQQEVLARRTLDAAGSPFWSQVTAGAWGHLARYLSHFRPGAVSAQAAQRMLRVFFAPPGPARARDLDTAGASHLLTACAKHCVRDGASGADLPPALEHLFWHTASRTTSPIEAELLLDTCRKAGWPTLSSTCQHGGAHPSRQPAVAAGWESGGHSGGAGVASSDPVLVDQASGGAVVALLRVAFQRGTRRQGANALTSVVKIARAQLPRNRSFAAALVDGLAAGDARAKAADMLLDALSARARDDAAATAAVGAKKPARRHGGARRAAGGGAADTGPVSDASEHVDGLFWCVGSTADLAEKLHVPAARTAVGDTPGHSDVLRRIAEAAGAFGREEQDLSRLANAAWGLLGLLHLSRPPVHGVAGANRGSDRPGAKQRNASDNAGLVTGKRARDAGEALTNASGAARGTEGGGGLPMPRQNSSSDSADLVADEESREAGAVLAKASGPVGGRSKDAPKSACTRASKLADGSGRGRRGRLAAGAGPPEIAADWSHCVAGAILGIAERAAGILERGAAAVGRQSPEARRRDLENAGRVLRDAGRLFDEGGGFAFEPSQHQVVVRLLRALGSAPRRPSRDPLWPLFPTLETLARSLRGGGGRSARAVPPPAPAALRQLLSVFDAPPARASLARAFAEPGRLTVTGLKSVLRASAALSAAGSATVLGQVHDGVLSLFPGAASDPVGSGSRSNAPSAKEVQTPEGHKTGRDRDLGTSFGQAELLGVALAGGGHAIAVLPELFDAFPRSPRVGALVVSAAPVLSTQDVATRLLASITKASHIPLTKLSLALPLLTALSVPDYDATGAASPHQLQPDVPPCQPSDCTRALVCLDFLGAFAEAQTWLVLLPSERVPDLPYTDGESGLLGIALCVRQVVCLAEDVLSSLEVQAGGSELPLGVEWWQLVSALARCVNNADAFSDASCNSALLALFNPRVPSIEAAMLLAGDPNSEGTAGGNPKLPAPSPGEAQTEPPGNRAPRAEASYPRHCEVSRADQHPGEPAPAGNSSKRGESPPGDSGCSALQYAGWDVLAAASRSTSFGTLAPLADSTGGAWARTVCGELRGRGALLQRVAGESCPWLAARLALADLAAGVRLGVGGGVVAGCARNVARVCKQCLGFKGNLTGGQWAGAFREATEAVRHARGVADELLPQQLAPEHPQRRGQRHFSKSPRVRGNCGKNVGIGEPVQQRPDHRACAAVSALLGAVSASAERLRVERKKDQVGLNTLRWHELNLQCWTLAAQYPAFPAEPAEESLPSHNSTHADNGERTCQSSDNGTDGAVASTETRIIQAHELDTARHASPLVHDRMQLPSLLAGLPLTTRTPSLAAYVKHAMALLDAASVPNTASDTRAYLWLWGAKHAASRELLAALYFESTASTSQRRTCAALLSALSSDLRLHKAVVGDDGMRPFVAYFVECTVRDSELSGKEKRVLGKWYSQVGGKDGITWFTLRQPSHSWARNA
ncbi:hypothetical protein DIPPA_01449 [Diplonema papillatum]|nr:hypothetical protein DIPPA_01449 [Diplonema papillatum]